MNWSDFMSIGALLVSVIIAINGLKKGKADTFSSYQDSLKKAQENYIELSNEFKEMKMELNNLEEMYEKLDLKYKSLEKNYKNILVHNKALAKQLIANNIIPITLEQAREYSTMEK